MNKTEILFDPQSGLPAKYAKFREHKAELAFSSEAPAGMRVNVRTIMHYTLNCYGYLLRRPRRFGVPAARRRFFPPVEPAFV